MSPLGYREQAERESRPSVSSPNSLSLDRRTFLITVSGLFTTGCMMQREEVPAEEEEKPEAAKQRLPINHPSLADTNLWDYGSEITVGTHTLRIAAPPGKEDQRRFHVDRTSYDVKTAWPTKYTPLPSPTKYVKGARLEQGELMIDLSGQGMEGKVWIPLDKFEAMIHALAEHAEDRIPVTIECFTDKPGDKARKTEKLPLTCVRLQPRAVAATAK